MQISKNKSLRRLQMKKIFLVFILLLTLSVFIMAQQCTINIPDKVGITIDTGQAQQTTQQQTTDTATSQTTGQQKVQRTSVRVSSTAEMVFLIITIVSFIIAVISAIFGYRKDNENKGGKILFSIFIILFIVFLILYILALVNII
jgi:hypothetical protein